MSDLRSSLIRIASELPKGDPSRRQILEVVSSKTAGMPHGWIKLDHLKTLDDLERAVDSSCREIKRTLKKWQSYDEVDAADMDRFRASVARLAEVQIGYF